MKVPAQPLLALRWLSDDQRYVLRNLVGRGLDLATRCCYRWPV